MTGLVPIHREEFSPYLFFTLSFTCHSSEKWRVMKELLWNLRLSSCLYMEQDIASSQHAC